jgi:hypothetical protein
MRPRPRPGAGPRRIARGADPLPKDIVVWFDPQSGLYYFKGHGSYGRSNAGRYACRSEADAAGMHGIALVHRNRASFAFVGEPARADGFHAGSAYLRHTVAGEASWLAAIREDGRADLIARGKGALETSGKAILARTSTCRSSPVVAAAVVNL